MQNLEAEVQLDTLIREVQIDIFTQELIFYFYSGELLAFPLAEFRFNDGQLYFIA